MSFNWNNTGKGLFMMPAAFLVMTPAIYLVRGAQFGFGNDYLHMYTLAVFAPAFFIIALAGYIALGNIQSHSPTHKVTEELNK
jgi:hypothetical protein